MNYEVQRWGLILLEKVVNFRKTVVFVGVERDAFSGKVTSWKEKNNNKKNKTKKAVTEMRRIMSRKFRLRIS